MKEDVLNYWICPNCRRRHDLIRPMERGDFYTPYPAAALTCDGCGNKTMPLEALDYQKQQKRKSMSSSEQLLCAIYENSEALEDLRIRLVRVEHLLEKIEQK